MFAITKCRYIFIEDIIINNKQYSSFIPIKRP